MNQHIFDIQDRVFDTKMLRFKSFVIQQYCDTKLLRSIKVVCHTSFRGTKFFPRATSEGFSFSVVIGPGRSCTCGLAASRPNLGKAHGFFSSLLIKKLRRICGGMPIGRI